MNESTSTGPRLSVAWIGPTLAIGWVLLYAIGMLGAHVQHASLWFPPAALTFGALLVIGLRAVPWLLLAIVAVTLWPLTTDLPQVSATQAVLAGLVFGMAHLVSYGLAALALQRLGRRAHDRLPLIVIDFLLVAIFGSLLASVLGPAALIATGLMEVDAATGTWLTFWVGDLVAVVVLAPWLVSLLMRTVEASRFRIEPLTTGAPSSNARFAFRLVVNALVISVAMLLNASLGTLESAFAVFALLLTQMWLTFSEPPRRTAMSVAFNSAVIVGWLFVLQLEPFVFVYQFAVTIVATVAYFGVAIPLLADDNLRLRERAMVDGLTGAASREFLERQAAQELDRASRTGAALCLLVVDLDHFKRINDAFGHVPGDRVLTSVTDAVRGVLRPGDVFARFGGDEFVALLPDTDPDVAGDIADRVREAIRAIELPEGRRLGASVGLTANVPDDDFSSLFERADQALYEAKRAGRDRIRIRTND